MSSNNVLAALGLAAACLLALPASASTVAPTDVAAAAAPTRFTVVVEGSGPDVILIPGLSTPRDVWNGARSALGGRYRLHLVQINGFGGTPIGANAQSGILPATVAELAAYIEANRLDRPAIVGHSVGGLLGLMLAQSAPDRVGRLMIVDALPFISTLFDPAATVESIAPRATAMRDMMRSQPATAEGAAAIAVGLARSEAGRTQVAGWVRQADAAVSAEIVYEAMTTDRRPMLAATRVPVTLLYAWDEGRLPRDRARAVFEGAYAGLPEITFVPVEGSYHFIMLDQPAAFEAALTRFLSAPASRNP